MDRQAARALTMDWGSIMKNAAGGLITAFYTIVRAAIIRFLSSKHADASAVFSVHCMNPDDTPANGILLVLSDHSSRFADGYGYLSVPASFRDKWADFYDRNRNMVGRHQLHVDERGQCEIQIRPVARKRKP